MVLDAALVAPLVLLSAFLNALWNALVKWRPRAEVGDKTLAMLGWVMGFGGLAAAAFLPFVPFPPPRVWSYLIASGIVQTGYAVLLAASYRQGDLSQVYPVVRGFSALLVALFSWLFAGEEMSLREWAGVAIAAWGIASLSLGPRARSAGLVAYPLLTGTFIAGYTFVDGMGARTMGDALAYFLWMCVCSGPGILAWGFAARGRAFASDLRAVAREGLPATAIAMASYGIAVWALSLEHMGRVAVLRETSVVFAAILGSLFLKEPFGRRRVLSAVLVGLGLVLTRGG
jgi:drug/metabolite transporter (DMT)-like permease